VSYRHGCAGRTTQDLYLRLQLLRERLDNGADVVGVGGDRPDSNDGDRLFADGA
jgi:hypothetical protein